MKELSLEEKIQRSLDFQEVQNVASLHEYYHAALSHKEEYENIWAHKIPDISWTNNSQRFEGQASFKKFYVETIALQKRMWLEELHKMRPDIEDKPENYGAGILWAHTLTTPVIQIAGDGKTAKGIWMSWGHLTQAMGGKFLTSWAYEKYGIDFIKEDGQWKIWHLHTFVDFYSPVDGTWTDPQTNGASNKERSDLDTPPPPDAPFTPDKMGEFYIGYSPSTVPKMEPKPPVPYYTFSETFSY
jgi:hypothetical protein